MSDLREYKCPCCGGAIEFNSTTQAMQCPYCGTEFDIDTLESVNTLYFLNEVICNSLDSVFTHNTE